MWNKIDPELFKSSINFTNKAIKEIAVKIVE